MFLVYSFKCCEYVNICSVTFRGEKLHVLLNLRTVLMDFATASVFDAVACRIRDCHIAELAAIYPRARSWLTRPHVRALTSFTAALAVADAAFIEALSAHASASIHDAFRILKLILNNPNTKRDMLFTYKMSRIYDALMPHIQADFRRKHAARTIFRTIKSAICNPYHPIGKSYQLREFQKMLIDL